MNSMFSDSQFNGDISNWDNVTNIIKCLVIVNLIVTFQIGMLIM